MDTSGDGHGLSERCHEYLSGKPGDGVKLAAAIRQSQPPLSDEETREIFRVAITSHSEHADNIAAAVMATDAGAKAIVERVLSHPTKTFKLVYAIGSLCFRTLIINVLLNEKAWSQPSDQTKAEKDIFTLLLAKLLEPGIDHPEIALFGIARLIAADWKSLADQVDSDAFLEFFGFLESDEHDAARSQATLIIAKIFEIDPERTQRELLSFTQSMLETGRNDKLSLACSAVGTLFPVMTKVGAGIVLQEGFLENVIGLVEARRDEKLRLCALELFSAACVDGACRKALREHVDEWAWRIVDDNKHVRGSREGAAAAVLVAKLRAEQTESEEKISDDDLVQTLKNMAMDDHTFAAAVEALSYQATQPLTKKAVADDETLLKRITKHLSDKDVTPVTAYTVFQLLATLTHYPPPLSEEQKKLLQVKAYADGTKPPSTHPLDEDGPVSERCKKLLDAGVAPAIVKTARGAGPSLLDIISRVLASLSKHPQHRGLMVQQGLLDVCLPVANLPADAAPRAKRNCALTVARILIPIDPALLFQKRPVERAIDPLVFLLSTPAVQGDTALDERWWRGFPLLNALQALANVATLPTSAPDAIVAKAWEAIEDAWQSDTPAIRTAATELILNLTQSESGLARFSSGDARAEHRWRIMSAYFGDEDLRLRSAAGGALAGLVADEAGAKAFLTFSPHAMEYLCEALADEDEGMRMRGLAIASSLTSSVTGMIDKQAVGAALAQMKTRRRIPAPLKEQFDELEKAVR